MPELKKVEVLRMKECSCINVHSTTDKYQYYLSL